MKKIRIADLAEGDLDGIWLYIAAKSGSEDIADGVVDSIIAGFSLLARAPKAGNYGR